MSERGTANFVFHVGSRRPDIACPACGFSPPVGMVWMCAPDGCGGFFDTFETRAHCPHCEAEFPWTQCPSCNKVSAHGLWYRGGS